KAIWGNVPDSMKRAFGSVDNITSGQFVNDVWGSKVERTPFDASKMTAYAPTTASAPGQTAIQAAMRDPNNMNPLQAQMVAQQQPNEYAYAPNYDQNAGLFDRLRQGGPGALFGAPGGVLPGKDGQRGYDLGNRLQRAGAWLMAANNPSVLGALGAINSE